MKDVDNLVTGTVAILGIYHLVTVGLLFLNLESSNWSLVNARTTERAFGQYWFGFWIFPIIYFGLTQFLWFRKMRAYNTFRIILSILILSALNFEKFVIIATSIHREYSPSGNPQLVAALTQSLLVNWLIYLAVFVIFLLIGIKIRNAVQRTV